MLSSLLRRFQHLLFFEHGCELFGLKITWLELPLMIPQQFSVQPLSSFSPVF